MPGFFLGFNGFFAGGRKFRLRKGNDANPFRGGPEQLIFGVGSNVKKPRLYDPATPYPLNENSIHLVYIRISPESTESWLINSAVVTISGTDFFGNPFSWSYTLAGPITLQEDSGEKVYLG